MPLRITIPGSDEMWDDAKGVFIDPTEDVTITLEHSLVSLSKWESKWQKPYLDKKEKTLDEALDYIKCMTLEDDVAPEVYERLTSELIKEIDDYIHSPMTATTINRREKPPGSHEVITSEIIYYQMTALNIPVEFQHWHLNRLLTLIEVCGIKSDPKQKKMSRRDLARERSRINASRRKALHSKG